MANPTIKIVNATTGEEIEREMNAEELAHYKDLSKSYEAEKAAEAAKQAAKQAGLEKLAALGLTAEEIAAITGA